MKITIHENGKRLTGEVTRVNKGTVIVQWSDGEKTEEDINDPIYTKAAAVFVERAGDSHEINPTTV